jgi:hypothetical protein
METRGAALTGHRICRFLPISAFFSHYGHVGARAEVPGTRFTASIIPFDALRRSLRFFSHYGHVGGLAEGHGALFIDDLQE